eukprot:1019122-Pyramimonas_sp.AAC.1
MHSTPQTITNETLNYHIGRSNKPLKQDLSPLKNSGLPPICSSRTPEKEKRRRSDAVGRVPKRTSRETRGREKRFSPDDRDDRVAHYARAEGTASDPRRLATSQSALRRTRSRSVGAHYRRLADFALQWVSRHYPALRQNITKHYKTLQNITKRPCRPAVEGTQNEAP